MAPWLDRTLVQYYCNSWVFGVHPGANYPKYVASFPPNSFPPNCLASFPIWGYSILLRLLESVTAVVVLQSFLGALATASLMVRLNVLLPETSRLTTALFLTSFPWLSWMACAYQLPMSAAFMILTLLALEMAIRTGRITWGITAGVLGAVGQNFRSELLLLPGTILVVVLTLRKLKWLRCPSIKPLAVGVGVALALQMPWALNCYFNAGRFSLSESNLGHVIFRGLGKLPRNPWGITDSDGFAQETVKKAGLDCGSLSFEGGDFLKREFLANVKQDPVFYAKAIAARFWKTIYLPFGFNRMYVTPTEKTKAHELVWQKVPVETFSYCMATEHVEQSGAVSNVKVAGLIFYSLSQCLLICAVSILGIIGFFLSMRTGPFRLNEPLILCLGVALLYRCSLNVALFDAGGYMISVYLCYLPFVINSLCKVSRKRLWR